MIEVSVPCGACGEPVRGGDDFCEKCGAQVTEDRKNALRARLEASDAEYANHRKRVRSARSTMAVLSGLFVLGGIVMFFVTRTQIDEALSKFPGSRDSIGGDVRTVLEWQPWQVLGLNLFLAVVMLGLWLWSKKALLAAIITALGVYVAVTVAGAIYDPATILHGLVMKIIVIAALGKGVQSALAARKFEHAR